MNIEVGFFKKSIFLHILIICLFSLGAFSFIDGEKKTEKEIVSSSLKNELLFEKDVSIVKAETISEKDVVGALEKIRSEKNIKSSEEEKELNKKLSIANEKIKKINEEIERKKQNLASNNNKIKEITEKIREKEREASESLSKIRKEKEELALEESRLKKKYQELERKNREEAIEKKKKEQAKLEKELEKIKKAKSKLKNQKEVVDIDIKNSSTVSNTDLLEYKNSIMEKVKSFWVKPSYASQGWECRAEIRQNKNGFVISVSIMSCSNDVPFKNSVIRAIKSASPLPLPRVDEIYDDVIRITFVVD